MITTDKNKIDINFTQLMNQLLSLLSDKEQDVIRRRFSLNGIQKETLDKIGQSYSITRERVRQIEAVAIKKLARISMDPSMQKVHELAFSILNEHGGLLSEDILISEMLLNLEDTLDIDVNSVKLAMKVSKKILKHEQNQFFKAFWRVENTSLIDVKDKIKVISKVLRKNKEVMTVEAINTEIDNVISTELIESLLNIDWSFKKVDDAWGLTQWRHINPKSIKDKIFIIFKNSGKPLHFTDIVNQISENFSDKKVVTAQAIHNELIRHEDFVLVGRGLYALKEWGIPAGTVCDLIRDVLLEKGEPMKRMEIIHEVLQKRDIREGTVSLNLQKHDFFKRVGRAVYEYDESLDSRKKKY
jgi:predicted Zn-ribbon and HTH transcriptional regulator